MAWGRLLLPEYVEFSIGSTVITVHRLREFRYCAVWTSEYVSIHFRDSFGEAEDAL